jgi:small-conductance mechanosensitive channel
MQEFLSSHLVAFTAALLLTVTLVHVVLRRSIGGKREAAPPSAAPEDRRSWIRHALRALATPLAIAVWIHGGWLLGNVLLRAFPGHPTAALALEWTYRLSLIAVVCWLSSRAGGVAEHFLVALAKRSATVWDDILLTLAGKALRRMLPVVAIILGAPALSISPELTQVVRNATSLVLIGVVALVLFEAVNAAATIFLSTQRIDVRDNLQARAMRTQVMVLKKVLLAAIAIFTTASMLMVFEPVRQFGASILASAGVAGIVIGFAAQRSIATLLAGFQIALTQPIRVDDVVIVENEWGRIEDITLTYVVVHIWDQRRLIVPISQFIEKPFQNWTRTSAEILGSIFIYVDYTFPIAVLRAEFERIVKESPLWDKRVAVLQVTDAREHTVEVRALASAADASQAWDLRCDIREKLVSFIQQHYPASLPRLRIENEPVGQTTAAAHEG